MYYLSAQEERFISQQSPKPGCIVL